MIHISKRAIGKAIELANKNSVILKISVTGGGCSGLSYEFCYIDTILPDDIQIYSKEITLITDTISYSYLAGSEIDYEDSLFSSGFIVNNPNALSQCSCNKSFSI